MTLSQDIAKTFQKKPTLKIKYAIIKLDVKNIDVVLILIRKATETIL